MLQTSIAYQELVKDNARPKVEPKIKVVLFNGEEFFWDANNITDLSFTTTIDPIGRELPTMELVWTELLEGKLTENKLQEIENTDFKFAQVYVTFSQDLYFFNTWGILKDSGKTWKQLKESQTTWKDLKEKITVEEISLPVTLLDDKPKIENNTITWKAKDFLGYLEQPISFLSSENSTFVYNVREILYKNANAGQLLNPIAKTIAYIDNNVDNITDETLKRQNIFDDSTKNLLLNFASAHNKYWVFKEDYMVLQDLKDVFEKDVEDVFYYDGELMYEYPTISKNSNISTYSFKYQNAEVETDESKWYQKYADGVVDFNSSPHYIYYYNGYGKVIKDVSTTYQIMDFFTYALVPVSTGVAIPLTIAPINLTSHNQEITNGTDGEDFKEENKLNFNSLLDDDSIMPKRNQYLNSYFNALKSGMTFSGLSNLAIEPSDAIKVDVDVYNDAGENLTKNAIVVSSTLEYNGALKQSYTIHEI